MTWLPVAGILPLGGIGGVSFLTQLIGTLVIAAYALGAGFVLYLITSKTMGVRLTDEQQRRGADLSIHSIGSEPEREF